MGIESAGVSKFSRQIVKDDREQRSEDRIFVTSVSGFIECRKWVGNGVTRGEIPALKWKWLLENYYIGKQIGYIVIDLLLPSLIFVCLPD
ncbi:hypothetical protein Tco_0210372 [Tanacetum coccineum]